MSDRWGYVFPKLHLAGGAVSEPLRPLLALPAPMAVTAFGDHSEMANVPVVVKKTLQGTEEVVSHHNNWDLEGELPPLSSGG